MQLRARATAHNHEQFHRASSRDMNTPPAVTANQLSSLLLLLLLLLLLAIHHQ
jgi:hypothetical protein